MQHGEATLRGDDDKKEAASDKLPYCLFGDNWRKQTKGKILVLQLKNFS